MKTSIKLLIVIYSLILGINAQGQTVKRVKDPHIVAQEKRQVFQQWGDWKPKGKYLLGVQVNVAHSMTWGMLAPSRNKDYRKGPDIRPLGPAGLQNLRYVTTRVQENKAEDVLDEVKDIHDETFDEYMHISSLTAQADPLYLLYYQKALRPLEQTSVTQYESWQRLGFTSWETFQKCNSKGLLNRTTKDLETLKDNYSMAKSADMPRGKRIILYHETLKEWRKIKKYVEYLNRQTGNRIKAEERLAKTRERKKNGTYKRPRRDVEIFVDVLMRNPY